MRFMLLRRVFARLHERLTVHWPAPVRQVLETFILSTRMMMTMTAAIMLIMINAHEVDRLLRWTSKYDPNFLFFRTLRGMR